MRNENDPRSLPTPPLWITPIAEWTEAMQVAQLAPRSIDLRTSHVRALAHAWWDVRPQDLTREQLLKWAAGHKWQAETRHSYYSSIRLFYANLMGSANNVAAALPRIRRSTPPPRPCPESVLSEALAKAPAREALFIELAATLGLRATEISRIHQKDLIQDLVGFSLLVHGKGQKDRLLPLDEHLAMQLIAWTSDGGGFAFPGQIDGHLAPQTVSAMARRYLAGQWTLHTLRHRFATCAYSAERDLLTVQQLLGHSSVATTQRYVRPPQAAVFAAMEAAKLPDMPVARVFPGGPVLTAKPERPVTQG